MFVMMFLVHQTNTDRPTEKKQALHTTTSQEISGDIRIGDFDS